MDEEEQPESEPGIQVVQLRWPLSLLDALLEPASRETVLDNLRCMSCPSFAMTDRNNLTWVVYHRPVLACFERVLQALLPCPPHTSYPQVFAGHALLGAVFERLFGPAIDGRSVALLDVRARALLDEYARRERLTPDGRALRALAIGAIIERIYSLPHIVPITDQGAKLSFLRYLLASLRDEGRDFPDRAAFLRLFADIRRSLEGGEATPGQPALIRSIERLNYTNKEASAYPSRGRIVEALLDNKPQVETAAEKLASYLKNGGIQALSSELITATNIEGSGPDAARAAHQVSIPAHIGPYLIQGLLGHGGMGTVYRARSPGGRSVALKVLHPELSAQVDDIVRWGREVEIARSLCHPHIVLALDHGVSEGQAFLAMQLLDGGGLEDLLRERGRLDEDETWSLVRQIASTLDYTWSLPKKYMHRDIKAENVLFDSYGRPKLADFGLATGTSLDATRFTRTGDVLGTPPYMAPEMSGHARQVDIRADLWSLGVLAFRCLTGRLPFEAPSTPAHYVPTPAEPGGEDEGAAPPEGSAPILERLLAPAPADRFQDPRALIDAIEERGFRPQAAGSPSAAPLVLEWRRGQQLVVFIGEELPFGRNSGQDRDLCLRVLPASQFADLTTCISGEHGRFYFDGARFLVEHQGANGLRKNGRLVERGAPEWLDFADRLSVAGVLDLEVWPQVAGLLITRPTNHSRQSYLLLVREYDLAVGAPSAGPRAPARLIARGGALFLAEPGGAAAPLSPGQVFELGGEAVRVYAAAKAMFKEARPGPRPR